MSQGPPAVCVNHRRRPRVAACGVCAAALCADCIVHTSVGIKCRNCTGVRGAGVGAGTRASAGSGRAAADTSARRPWPQVLVAAGVVVLAVAGYGLISRKSSPAVQVDSVPTPTASERNSEFVGAGGLRIGGTLTLPDGAPDRVPAVLIVPGLGALNRNAVAAAATPDASADALASSLNPSSPGTVDNLYQDISKALAQAGIASLRYDKRGTVNSALKPDQKLSFDDEVADARAALEFLTQRREIGTAALAVVGHDEGGLVALRAAAGMPQVKAAVLLSTPGRPLADVLVDDLTRIHGPEMGDQLRAAVGTLKATGAVPAAQSLVPLLRPLFPAGADAYLSALFSIDPSAELKAAPGSVLVVRGGGDKTVTAADADRLSSVPRPGIETLVGSSDADHNLALPVPDHAHGNGGAPPVQRDAEPLIKLSTWVKTHVAA